MRVIMFEVLMMFLVFNVDIVAGIIQCGMFNQWDSDPDPECENPTLLGLIPLNPMRVLEAGGSGYVAKQIRLMAL